MAESTYDPIKAHEYYEKHKKLKGRRSTKGFSQEQKELYSYGKDQINEAYKAKVKGLSEENKEKLSKISEDAKAQKKRITAETKAQVDTLRRRLKSLSPEGKAQMREQLQGLIDNIREKASLDKLDISGKAAKDKASQRDTTKLKKEAAKAVKEKNLDALHKKIKGA